MRYPIIQSILESRDGRRALPFSNDSRCAGTSAIRWSTAFVIQENEGSSVAVRGAPKPSWTTDRVLHRGTRCCPTNTRVRPHKTHWSCPLELRWSGFHGDVKAVGDRLSCLAEMKATTPRRTLWTGSHRLACSSVCACVPPRSSQRMRRTRARGLPLQGFLPARAGSPSLARSQPISVVVDIIALSRVLYQVARSMLV